MYKVAVIFESSPFDRKGLFNAVHERIKALKASGQCIVDAYCIHSRDNAFTRSVRHTPQTPDVAALELEGVTYKFLWYRFSIFDHVVYNKMHLRPFFFGWFMDRSLSVLDGYDCVIAHSFTGGVFALEANRRYGIPYFVNWHGSDIHTHPWKNPLQLSVTKEVMRRAVCNFFVSQALMRESDNIVEEAAKQVIYNGVSDNFVRFSEDERAELRREFALDPHDKVVAFVGNLSAVKNPGKLQPIFSEVRARYDGKLKFWVIGDGKLRKEVEAAIAADPSIDVRFWGNQPSEMMPAIMNLINVLVLPSLNEGLPLVCAEAISCGANVVASAVGGIAEVIGVENTVVLDDDFVQNMAQKVVSYLNAPTGQTLSSAFSWTDAASRELQELALCLSTRIRRPKV
jgi:glycosyltransferase involved in cell wall biosynthesis